jgi:hypothetical protein
MRGGAYTGVMLLMSNNKVPVQITLTIDTVIDEIDFIYNTGDSLIEKASEHILKCPVDWLDAHLYFGGTLKVDTAIKGIVSRLKPKDTL